MKIPGSIKLLFSLLMSALFLFLIYRKIDFKALTTTLKGINPGFFVLYFLLFIPQLLLAAFRWRYILKKFNNYSVSFYNSLQMVTGSYSANLVVPAKMGEVVRVFWVDKTKSKYKPILIVLFEKLWDLFSVWIIFCFFLFFLFSFGENFHRIAFLVTLINILGIFLLFVIIRVLPKWKKSGKYRIMELASSLLNFFIQNKRFLLPALFWSLALWMVQIFQFYFMFRVFGIQLPIAMVLSGSSLAVLAGAVVISIGGIGPRDATLLWFFSGLVTKEVLVSVGIISVFRIIIPALIGIPFFIYLSIRFKPWKKASGNN
ncbi:hypothetical protein ES705_18895 [subsurface metagenome]